MTGLRRVDFIIKDIEFSNYSWKYMNDTLNIGAIFVSGTKMEPCATPYHSFFAFVIYV